MIAAKRLPVILQSILNEGIEGVCLMTVEGSILSSAFLPTATVDEISLAAISGSIYTNYSNQGGNEILFHLAKLQSAYLGISLCGKSYLIVGYGKVAPGLLRSRLQSLSQYFGKVFEQIK